MDELNLGYDSAELARQESEAAKTKLIRLQCRGHIERYYPIWKQINILRAGTDEEKAKMSTFIDACRTWSNGENPDPAALAEIKP